jgi:LCP family protein required for cell wall assembly
MNKARGCFISIVVIFFLSLVVILCILLPNISGGTGEGQIDLSIGDLSGSKNLLFLGIDEEEGIGDFKGRTDTIIVFHIGSWGEKDSLISIPRDTRVYLEGHGWNKINAAYVYGGEEMLKQEIYELTDIVIDKTMLLNFEGFKKIIDILGGVEIVIDEPLHDHLSGADFDPGTYVMNGEQALSFARCRATAKGDLDRIDRQQYLLNEIMKQKINFSSITKTPDIITVLSEDTKSDFSIGDFGSVGFVLLFSNKDINRITIPTTYANIDGISYLIADEDEVKEFLSLYLE